MKSESVIENTMQDYNLLQDEEMKNRLHGQAVKQIANEVKQENRAEIEEPVDLFRQGKDDNTALDK